MDVLIYIIVAIGILLVVRLFWLWYWKVDVIVNKLEQIERHLAKIAGSSTGGDPHEIRVTPTKTIDNKLNGQTVSVKE